MSEWVYVRWVGAVCNAIPMIILEIISFLGGSIRYGQTWILSTFLPLIFLGYTLDLFYSNIPLISRLQNPLFKIGVSWTLLFPLVSLLRDIILYSLTQNPIFLLPYYTSPLMKIMGALLLGFIYGVFFLVAYSAIVQFLKKKNKK